MKKFTYRRSVLNIGVLIWLILGIIFMVEHSEEVGSASGKGMSASLIWVGVATIAIIVDILLQYYIKKRSLVNIIEGILVFGFVLFVRAFLIV